MKSSGVRPEERLYLPAASLSASQTRRLTSVTLLGLLFQLNIISQSRADRGVFPSGIAVCSS
jgi:hypothetical protein